MIGTGPMANMADMISMTNMTSMISMEDKRVATMKA